MHLVIRVTYSGIYLFFPTALCGLDREWITSGENSLCLGARI